MADIPDPELERSWALGEEVRDYYRAAHAKNYKTFYDRIAELEALLGQREQDTQRLDWLEESEGVTRRPEDGICWCPGHVGRTSIRQAIDAARGSAPGETP